MRANYHSAFYPERATWAADRFQGSSGVAFVHDIMAGPLPAEYDSCDVFYMDPPWRNGFQTFNERADIVDGRAYEEFTTALIAALPADVPTVIVTGKHARPFYPDEMDLTPVRLNEHDAIAYTRHVTLPAVATTDDVLSHLARTYQHVGDPCCGYGNTARAFMAAGKRYTVSDINPRCIGYIASNSALWSPANVLS